MPNISETVIRGSTARSDARLRGSGCTNPTRTTERLLRTTSTLGINFIVLQFRSLRKINRVL